MTQSSGNALGIGIIGAGFMGETYARTIDTLVERARITAIAGGSRAPDLAAQYSVDCADSVEALLERDDVDAVCIATPHALHGPQGLATAKAGKHLLIDKPMACSVNECDAIIEASQSRGLRCEITYTQRERVCNLETKRLIDSGEFGRVLYMSNTQVVPDGMNVSPTWQRKPENVGILMGHGIHNIDQVRWFTGREVERVFAKVRHFAPGFEVDTTSDVTLTLDDGTVCTIFCSFEAPKPGFPRMGGSTKVMCENGLIDCDWYGEMLASSAGGEWEVRARQEPIDWAGKGFLDPVRLKTYAQIIQRLVDGALAGDVSGDSAWDGRQAVAIAEAAYESSRTGTELKLPKTQRPAS